MLLTKPVTVATTIMVAVRKLLSFFRFSKNGVPQGSNLGLVFYINPKNKLMNLKFLGEINTHDLPFDIALLMELLGWFKHKYFKWVDKPECKRCGGPTKFAGSSAMRTPAETCTVEVSV